MKRPPLRTTVGIGVAVVVVVTAAVVVVRNRGQLARSIHQLGWHAAGLSFALGLAGVFVLALMWRAVLTGLGAPTQFRPAARLFFVSQLGKYLPGSVWPIVSQMEFGRRQAIARRTMLSANLITLALNLTVGLIAAAVLLPLSDPSALSRFWWAFLLLPLLLACLHPRAIPALIDAAFRLLGREPMSERLTARSLVVAVGWAMTSWVLLGLHLYVITHALGAHGFTALAAAIGGTAFAVAVGIAVIPAPAGAGVRDAVLVLTLSSAIGASSALAAALASRVLLVLVDLTLAGGFALARPAAATPAPR